MKALIFDFDGLILDTEVPDYQAWQHVYQSHNANLPLEKWVECVGRGVDDIPFDLYEFLAEQTGAPVDRDQVRRQRQTHFQELIAGYKPLPGVETLLRTARSRGLGIAVASSSDCAWVNGHLNRLNLRAYFDTVQCADLVERTKPAPDLYLAALAALGVTADQAIAFEDSPNGVMAARSAGIFCVAVPNGITQGLDFGHASLRLNSLVEMSLDDLLAHVSGSKKLSPD